MKFHIFVLLAFIFLTIGSFSTATAQVDSVIGQVTSTTSQSFAGGVTGDGRFVVFESSGNAATVNPRNTDGNREIFLFDYAQRQIFQLTDTKSLLTNAANAPTFDNIRVDIVNARPAISIDGRWIAFSSNATCAYPGSGTNPAITSVTNPGNFDANNAPLEPSAADPNVLVNKCLVTSGTTTTNNLINDGNTELWLYQVPVAPPVADLSSGEEIPFVDLGAGTFTRVTNTLPSRLPVAGTSTSQALIAEDNRDASVNSNGDYIAFSSTRDLVPAVGNPFPSADNDEIFVFVRNASTITQITKTPRGTVGNPLYNLYPAISANGLRVAFISNANNPINGMTGDLNTDLSEEIFYADLNASGAIAAWKQVTRTTRTNPGDVVNIWNYGPRISRDGRYLGFDSYADLGSATPGANQPGFATFIYDDTTSTFRQVGVRSNADSAATGGDIQRYPTFTDYNATGTPQTVLLTTRMNILPNGNVATTASEGLNNIPERPAQVYQFPLNTPAASATFTRITKLPAPLFFLPSIQALPTDTSRRVVFNLAQTETGTGNSDLSTEVYYTVNPTVVSQTAASLNFATGASRIPVTASPVPTPSPTATPTPSPSPTGSPTPTPTPTPQQPAAVQGVSPGMLAILDYNSGTNQPVIARTAVGSINRRFQLPIELSGVTMTINGAAVGLKMVSQRQIVFVVPPGLAGSAAGTSYPVVINNNGVVFKGNITVVSARPDIFTNLPTPGPGGRARVFNATNRVLTTEPFTIRTFRLRGSRLVPSVLRVYLTGVDQSISRNDIIVRIGSTNIVGSTSILTVPTLVEPGVYAIDFTLPATLAGAGDQPLVITVTAGGATYTTRLDDTAPRLSIL